MEIGTGQFQVLPERQAERYIAARAESGRAVVVASQGFDVWSNRLGRVDHFERLFKQTCKRLGTERLELYGIACIDDREAYEENVWGLHGMVEFLQKWLSEERRIRCDHVGLQRMEVALTYVAASRA